MPEIYGVEAFSPSQIAEKIEAVGVEKARLPLGQMLALEVLSGGFIGFGSDVLHSGCQ